MIIFNKIRFKNFLSTGNNFTEYDLSTGGKTLILGKNGQGKSQLLDAITYVLFNKSFRNTNKPNLINNINKKHMLVEIEFMIGDKEYIIRRGMKPNLFEIQVNGNLLSQSSTTRDYQEYLEKNILKFNFRTFTQIAILGSSNYVPFMRLPLAARREIIEEILDINIFSKMNVLLKDKFAVNKEESNDISNRIIIDREKLKIYEEQLQNSQAENREKTLRLYKEATELDEDIKELQFQIQSINEQIIAEQSKNILKELNAKQSEFNTARWKVEKNLKEYNKKIEFFNNNSACPTCAQDIEEKFKLHKLENYVSYKRGLEGTINKIDSKVSDLKVKIAEQVKLIDNISSLENDKTKFDVALRTKLALKSKINAELKASIGKKNDPDTAEKIASLKKSLDFLETEKAACDGRFQILSYAASLLRDNGIKAKIIEQYGPIINNNISHYLQLMDYYVNFSLNENFEESVSGQGKDQFTYWNFSEGERQRIDLALLFTFRSVAKLKNSLDCNILILDEIFDSSMDNSGTEDLINVLEDMTDTTIFVISHKSDHLADKFDNVITVKKENNFSVMEYN